LKPSISSESDSTPKTAKISVTAIDPNQQKIDRAKKFNLPLSESDRKNLRAERFGTGNDSKATAPSKLTTNNVKLDPELLQKRAQRFGVPVVKTSKTASTTAKPEDEEKLKQRAERFGLPKETETIQGSSNGAGKIGDEKLLKRQMRFGGGAAAGSKDTGEAGEKKKARAERFGLTNASSE